MSVFTALVFVLLPAAIIYAAHRFTWIERLGVIVICYGLGILIGAGGLVPASAQGAAVLVSEVTVVLALPMLLFSLDVRSWSRVAGKAVLSLLFAVTAVTCIASALFFLFRGEEGAANYAAMSVGVYSGGTPNLAAIKTGLAIPNEQYLGFHSLDTFVGALYFLFMLTLGVPLFRVLLVDGRPSSAAEGDRMSNGAPDENDYRPFLKVANWRQVVLAFGLSLAVVLVSYALALGVAKLTGGELNSAVLIVAITTLGILLSLHPKVHSLVLSYRAGMYLICVFCLVVGSMVSLRQLASLDASIAMFLFTIVFGGLALHALLCRLAGVDSDTFMVTSVAAVTSPPFVPLMARALDNPGAMLPGMTTGVIGYALGSYLGISLGLYLRSLQ